MRSFSMSKIFGRSSCRVPDDDATFERQEHLGRELQDTVGIRPIDAELSARSVRSTGICRVNLAMRLV